MSIIRCGNAQNGNQNVISLKLTTECTTKWDDMDGSARVRYCHICKHNVYDTEGMSDLEAVEFVARIEGVESVNLHRRADGRVVSAEAARRSSRGWHRLSASLAATFLVGALLVASVPPPVYPASSAPILAHRHMLFHRVLHHHAAVKPVHEDSIGDE